MALSVSEKDVLITLYRFGSLDDSDIPSKLGRDGLIDRGYVNRNNGMNWLTEEGMQYCRAQPGWKAKDEASV